MRKTILATATLLFSALTSSAQGVPLRIWDNRPGSFFENSMPIGNGKLGAMVDGNPHCDYLKLNDITLWSGKPIDPKAQYRVVTNDYVVQGNDGMPAFKEGTQLVAPQSEENNVRYVMMDYFREQMKAGKTVCGKREGRITIE